MDWLHRFLLKFRFYQYFLDWLKVVYIPGFRPLPVYTVASFFFAEIKQYALINKSSSLAYSFLLAIFPGIIFLFTLIPYIPFEHFQQHFLDLLQLILPTNAYIAFQSTIEDVVKKGNAGLLSTGFLSAMLFATNGVNKLMREFNKSSLIEETRSWYRRRWIALVLTIMICISLFVAIIIMVISQSIIGYIQFAFNSNSRFWIYLITLLRWTIVIILYWLTVSILYRYGPAHKRRWKFVNPGSVMATSLAILTSIGFSFYINNFSAYNKIYGSIGTLIVVMIWLYFNSMIVLLGFELNAAIDLSKRTVKIVKPKFNAFKAPKV